MRAFWLLSSAFLLVALVMAGLLINLIPLLREIGLSPQAAASTSAGVGIGLLFARVAVGFLLDRFQARYVAVAAFGVAALGCLLLAGQRTEFATFAVFALGFTSGAELDLLAYMRRGLFRPARPRHRVFHRPEYLLLRGRACAPAGGWPVRLRGGLYSGPGSHGSGLYCRQRADPADGALSQVRTANGSLSGTVVSLTHFSKASWRLPGFTRSWISLKEYS